MFEKILVPLDGSARAEEALAPSLALAKSAHGEVILLHSIIPVYTTMPMVASEYDWIWPEYAREESRQEARDYLEVVKNKSECPGCQLRTLTVEGDAAGMIVDTADDEMVDLIVMSTHGRSGVGRVMLGSVTERVLHSAHCPVLVTRSPRPIRRVLVTLDGSRLAERALPPALELAERLGATVHLLRINEAVSMPAEDRRSRATKATVMPDEMIEHIRRASELYMEDVLLRHHLRPGDVPVTVAEGQPVERILEFVDLHGIDLIAMSTHGHTGLRRWLYGSVTLKVMRSTNSSMLIVRPPEEAFGD